MSDNSLNNGPSAEANKTDPICQSSSTSFSLSQIMLGALCADMS
jgi:hypothetical protein